MRMHIVRPGTLGEPLLTVLLYRGENVNDMSREALIGALRELHADHIRLRDAYHANMGSLFVRDARSV